MAILRGIVASVSITARRSVKEQIQGAYLDFKKKVEQQATDLDKATGYSVFSRSLQGVCGTVALIYDEDNSSWKFNLPYNKSEKTIAVRVRSLDSQLKRRSGGSIVLLKAIYFGNGLLDEVVPIAEIDQIHQIVKAIAKQ